MKFFTAVGVKLGWSQDAPITLNTAFTVHKDVSDPCFDHIDEAIKLDYLEHARVWRRWAGQDCPIVSFDEWVETKSFTMSLPYFQKIVREREERRKPKPIPFSTCAK